MNFCLIISQPLEVLCIHLVEMERFKLIVPNQVGKGRETIEDPRTPRVFVVFFPWDNNTGTR
jgi:hypothetical protein